MAHSGSSAPLALDALLRRSTDLDAKLEQTFDAFDGFRGAPGTRGDLVAASCELAVEHGLVLREAMAMGAANAGSALLRLQFEALLRGAWLRFVASEGQLAKLTAELGLDTELAAKGLPGVSEMLVAVEATAPTGLAQPLTTLYRTSRHAMNSFVHAGLHPLYRVRTGYPEPQAVAVVRFSNAVGFLACRLAASLSNSQPLMDRVTGLSQEFADCLPLETSDKRD